MNISGALYICTEDVFPNKRLMQMLHFFKQKHASIGIDCSRFSDNIFIEHAADLVSQLHDDHNSYYMGNNSI